MIFSLTEDEQQLAETLESFLGERYKADAAYTQGADPTILAETIWTALEELSLLEAFKTPGATFGVRALEIVARGFGRHLVCSTLIDRLIVQGITCEDLSRSGIDPTGIRIALAAGPDTALSVADGRVTGEIPLLSGSTTSTHVLFWGAAGQACITTVKNPIRLHSLDRTTPLINARFNGEPVITLKDDTSRRVRSLLRLVRSAEIVGCLERSLLMTVDHTTAREQFGVPVGGFQAIQAKMADIYQAKESLGALVRFAGNAIELKTADRELAADSALLHAVNVGPPALENAIQCHGGIGFTWEYPLHYYLRRVRSIAALYGGTAIEEDVLSSAGRVVGN